MTVILNQSRVIAVIARIAEIGKPSTKTQKRGKLILLVQMTANLKQGGPPNSSADAGFQFWRAFARHWRESVRYFGWWRSLRELADACWNALLELLPSRRKARFGDLDYDWEHSVDTTRSNVGFSTQFLTGLTARPYFATEPWLFAADHAGAEPAFSNQHQHSEWVQRESDCDDSHLLISAPAKAAYC